MCPRLVGRLLEEGNVEAAEEQKQRIEELQRERRRELEEKNLAHQPKFFRQAQRFSGKYNEFNSNPLTAVLLFSCIHRKTSDDTWVSNNTYWELRKDPGFSQLDFPKLWWHVAIFKAALPHRLSKGNEWTFNLIYWTFALIAIASESCRNMPRLIS